MRKIIKKSQKPLKPLKQKKQMIQKQEYFQHYLLGNGVVSATRTQNLIKFQNLKTGQIWSYQKLNQTAGQATLRGQQVTFGFPKLSATIYPGQTYRLNSGWSMQSIPVNNMVNTIPHKALLQNDLIGIPQVADATFQGGQLVQMILNNSQYPIQLSLKQDGTQSIQKLDPHTLQSVLTMDWMNLLNTTLITAAHILPFFI